MEAHELATGRRAAQAATSRQMAGASTGWQILSPALSRRAPHMPLVRPRLALAVVPLTLACLSEAPAVVRVGDAIPRSLTSATLLDLVQPLLATTSGPRLEVSRWSLASSALHLAEADQAKLFADDPSVIAVVGHAGSKGTLLAAPVYRDAGLPLLIPTATARELRDIPGFFMLAPSDDAVGAFLADAAADTLRARRIATMHVADAYGEGINRGITERLAARGIPVAGQAVLTGLECDADRLAARAITLSLLRRADPDVVILALSQTTTICVIETLVAAKPGIRILTSDSYTPADHAEITAAQRRAVHALLFWEPGTDSLNRDFVARFRRVVGREPDAGQALAYDAYVVIHQAVREGVTTRAALADWLRALGTEAHPPVQGVTGPIDFRGPRRAVLHLRRLGGEP